jgi:hypothetical protein
MEFAIPPTQNFRIFPWKSVKDSLISQCLEVPLSWIFIGSKVHFPHKPSSVDWSLSRKSLYIFYSNLMCETLHRSVIYCRLNYKGRTAFLYTLYYLGTVEQRLFKILHTCCSIENCRPDAVSLMSIPILGYNRSSGKVTIFLRFDSYESLDCTCP